MENDEAAELDLPLGSIRADDVLYVGRIDRLCSRCREQLGENEVPLLMWPMEHNGNAMYQFCQRCAFDPHSDRCRVCGCTELCPCEEPCGWAGPGICTNCLPEGA